MGRLTEYDENGDAKIIGVDRSYLLNDLYEPSYYYVDEALRRLAHYEDLQSQGRLIELPCKIGDTVYQIRHYYNKLESILPGPEEPITKIVEIGFNLYNFYEIGRTTFLTYEEAVAALEGSRNG